MDDTNKTALKSMLNNLINDKHEEASLDLHGYFTNKMKELSGLSQQAAPEPTVPTGGDSDPE
jgi:hypothetical protein